MRAKIQTKLAAAFSGGLADAVQDVVLRRTVRTADKIRGTFEEAVQTVSGRGVCRLGWRAEEAAALGIPQTDGKAVLLQSEWPFAPKEGDVLDFGAGAHKVVAVRQDPAGAAWFVQYRKA